VRSIAAVPAGRIFLVQLSGCNGELDGAGEAGARRRLFPGEGTNAEAVIELVRTLRGAGYVGEFSLEAASDEYEQSLPAAVADRARRSAEWITEQLRDPG
jgi:sugar phosphate isomerase/epimerase